MPASVPVFTPYPFVTGEKINISSGPRQGDWMVVGVDERKITLRCPLSGKEYSWDRFCYMVGKNEQPWPAVSKGEGTPE